MIEVVHFLSGLRYGGKEQIAVRLAHRGIASGQRHRLLLYDSPFDSAVDDIDPGSIPWRLLRRPRRFWPPYAFRLARGFDPMVTTVVHAHDPTAITYAALSRLAWPFGTTKRVRVVATFHANVDHLSSRALGALRVAVAGCDRVCGVSEALVSHLRDKLNRGGIEVVPNGVDTEVFRPAASPSARLAFRSRHGISQDAFVVGTLGRLDPVKRQSDLIDAVAVARRRGARIHAVIAGAGPLRNDLEARAAGLGGVLLIGAIDDPAGFLAGIDAFALPSAYEAAPLVLLEALASGIPAVATAVGGIPEIVGSAGTAAVLVPPCDPDALGAALSQIAAEPGFRARLAASGRQRAIERSEDHTWLAYRRWYDSTGISRDT
jgi:L-malate glycosyltransferase